ncbi:hypothetical protein rtp1 [Escherichia phage Rtp]|uniref:Uncharacterized protein n=1 Tax=Escherichia phage Rtp TaxID=2994041 RepID=Q333I3_9CAUD|nr:hypothetical protein rtp1 [Escherichia phage Rtp]CAJ42205.1 hypothetical protein [Escherichia phage Rtp]
MSEHKAVVSLGEVVRYMAKKALSNDTKSFLVPVRMIAQQVYGLDKVEMTRVYQEDLEPGGKYHMNKLKSSYVSNTVSRMPEIKSANVRARLSIKDAEFEGEVVRCAVISLVPGAINSGSRNKAEAEKEAATIERFKARLLKLSPSVAGLEGDELKGAVAMINAYQEMIKETN